MDWKEGLKEAKKRILTQPKTPTERGPRRKKLRVKNRRLQGKKTCQPFSRLGEMIENAKPADSLIGEVREYPTMGEAEPVLIQAPYSINDIERLVQTFNIKHLVARIESFGGAYFQINLVKERLLDGGMAAQRAKLEKIGSVIAHGDGKHWKFEEEEDLGYY